jgi:hypothetical protein
VQPQPALGNYSSTPAYAFGRPADGRQIAPAAVSGGPAWIMGMSEQSALQISGDPDGNAFDHDHGDIANRWSHASIAAMARETLRGAGVPGPIAVLMGASILVPRELLIDDNPSASDLALDLELYRQAHGPRASSVSVTVFGDGAVFLGMWRRF